MSENIVERLRDAIAYSHNFATAKPDIGATEREHILGLCGILGDAVAAIERALSERDTAVLMLAEWCRAIDENGTGWDDWDEHYKTASYRPGPLRKLIDAALAKDGA